MNLDEFSCWTCCCIHTQSFIFPLCIHISCCKSWNKNPSHLEGPGDTQIWGGIKIGEFESAAQHVELDSLEVRSEGMDEGHSNSGIVLR